MPRSYSTEYLEEALKEAKKYLPGWLFASLVKAARARAGGRASHRKDGPTTIEKLALTEIRPGKLRDVKDDELGAVWLRLHQWYSSAKRRSEAVEDIVNAALWVKAEIERRGRKVSASPLVAAVAELEAVKKARGESVLGKVGEVPRFIGRRLAKSPDEILLIRDFVSIAGSAAVAERPEDIDVVLRADYDGPKGSYLLDGSAMWVALRRFLAPDKRGPQMQLLGAPQGSFTDYIPMFDLVLRRRAHHVERIEPTPPEYKDRERVIKGCEKPEDDDVEKQARAATAEIRAQAEKAKRDDAATLGEFFYQPKPTRPAFEEEPQTVDRLLELFEERREKWLPTWVQKKYDGCLPGYAKVETEFGPLPIRDIVRSGAPIKVKSFNFKTRRMEWKQVTGHFDNGKAEEFVSISVAGGKSRITCTPNHEIYLASGRKVTASEIVEGDEICYRAAEIGEARTSFIRGMLLGDSFLIRDNRRRYPGLPRISTSHSVKQAGYLSWKCDLLSMLGGSLKTRTSQYGFPGFRWDSLADASLLPLWNELYHDGAKEPTLSYLSKLDAVSLAAWIMDDGSLAWNVRPRLQLHTEGFSREINELMQEYFSESGYGCSIYEYRGYSFLGFNVSATERMIGQSKIWFCEDMAYKAGNDQTALGSAWASRTDEVHETVVPRSVVEVRRFKPAARPGKFDIEVADNHNYFVNGILISNSRHQIHKNGSEVKIFSEDGDDNTDRLPGIVKAVQDLAPHKLILDAEIERWRGGKHLPRESVAGYLAERSEPDDSELVANVFDVLNWKGEDVHKRQLRLRLEYLKQLGKGTMGVPPKGEPLNIAPGLEAKTVADVKKAVEKIRRLPGSEGIVAKQMESAYPLDVKTLDTWVKFHNASLVRAVVTKSKRTKGGVWTYSYAVKRGKENPIQTVAVGGEKLVPVGESFATGLRFRPGDKILIEAETVNKIRQPQGVAITVWVPRVLGSYDGETDTLDQAVKRASDNLVLRTKEADERGEVTEYLPENVIKAARGRVDVPTVGPQGAAVAFVGASPGRVEAARREPFVGPAGETLNEIYLKPLGLKRSEVLLTNAVPKLLEDDKGRTREPTVDELKEWRDWLEEQLDAKKPEVIVALGRTAESALGGRADLTLPHPSAVRRFGDSGEVGRKMRRLRTKLKKTAGAIMKQLPKPLLKPEAEGGTRSTRAFTNWEKNWNKLLPRSGKGKFVYQHHWRGLSEDELGMTDADLMKKTDHSIHGDLRLSGEDGLFGFTIFLGETKDNRGEHLDKLIDWKADDNIEVTPKLGQPEEWLEVGRGKPLVSPPGEVGATSEKYSKFFERDHGTYELGVARKHMVEIFLDGEHLNGRYLMMFAPVAGRRRWLIDKPEDQTPYAETRDLADVLGELRKKNQKFLVWGKPGEKPRFIHVQSGQVEKGGPVAIAKADTEKRIVYGVVLDPYGDHGPEADAHNDWNPPGEIEKTAHEFAKRSRVIGLQHQKKADAEMVESFVEPYPSRRDYLAALAGQPHRVYRRPFGDDVIHSGAWVMGVELGPEEWKLFKDGKLNAFSPGGVGSRIPLKPSEMPDITFVDIVETPTKDLNRAR